MCDGSFRRLRRAVRWTTLAKLRLAAKACLCRANQRKGQGNSLLAIRLGRTGDLTGTDAIAWSYKKNTPYVPSPLLYGGKLYFFASNNGIFSCLDAKSGEVLVDAERVEALQGVYASLLGAARRIYLTGRNGATIVLNQSDKLDVLATNRLDEKFDASPAVASKELFLRGREYLYCIAEK